MDAIDNAMGAIVYVKKTMDSTNEPADFLAPIANPIVPIAVSMCIFANIFNLIFQ